MSMKSRMQNQIHDFSPPIPASGLFWTVPVTRESVSVDLEGGSAILRVQELEVPDWTNVMRATTHGPHVASRVSFDVRWHDVLDRAERKNDEERWRGNFIQTEVSIEWSAQRKGYSYISDVRQSSRTDAGIIGSERTGSYFS